MVEITIPIVLQIVQTVGILVGIIYYITIMRNSQRTQQLQLETRKAQLYMQLFTKTSSEDFAKKALDLLRIEISNIDEFFEKYILGSDPSMHAKLFSMFWHIDGLGYMMSQELIDPEMVYNLGGARAHCQP